MKIWRLADPYDYRFARASRRGSWSRSSAACSECGASTQRRIQPLVLEWEPGSALVGDFTWPGFGSDVAITEQVARSLEMFGGFEAGPVEMFQEPKLKRGSASRSSKPRVWLPYEGSRLYDLWVTHHVHLDHERSSVSLVKHCSTCGRRQYTVDGIERWETGWDQERRESVKTHVARSPRLGIYVAEHAIAGNAIFRTHELPGWILCTDAAKELVEKEAFTNVSFLEAGETL